MGDANSIIANAQGYANNLQQHAEAFVATLQYVAQPNDPLIMVSGAEVTI